MAFDREFLYLRGYCMRIYMYIGCGSFLGAVLRYLIKNNMQLYSYPGIFPLNTFFINITGALFWES